ncbi:HIT family protein [Candidatus Woesearchaeota archaeon]|nr:HIT family protein [Candidatus Woesearchaeota archaeon]MBT5342481.1 HIT family protein [Candidatus Woesearchaeota archaeon]
MKCEHCDIVERKSKADILYEDDEVVVAIKDLAMTPGQITVFPKEHFTILEVVPEEILEKCSLIANKIGIAVFESLGSQGTNIIIQNGLGAGQKVPHFAIEVVPRVENDGLGLQWDAKQLAEDEMATVFMTLEQGMKELDSSAEAEKTKGKDETGKDKKNSKEDDKNNYLLKSLKKIP